MSRGDLTSTSIASRCLSAPDVARPRVGDDAGPRWSAAFAVVRPTPVAALSEVRSEDRFALCNNPTSPKRSAGISPVVQHRLEGVRSANRGTGRTEVQGELGQGANRGTGTPC